MVIHAVVDEFSLLPVFVGNKFLETMLALLEDAVHRYGLRNRVRSDGGGENIGCSNVCVAKKRMWKSFSYCWPKCPQSTHREVGKGLVSRLSFGFCFMNWKVLVF